MALRDHFTLRTRSRAALTAADLLGTESIDHQAIVDAWRSVRIEAAATSPTI